jgi:hypothetical protein
MITHAHRNIRDEMNNHKSSKKKAVQINLSACDKYVITSKTRRVYITKERKEASENK